MSILLLVTGGTFDKKYDELTGKLSFRDTHVPKMLEAGRCKLDVVVRTAMLIDSLEMTEGDRQFLLAHIQREQEREFVITHGTDTMVETAAVLAHGLAVADKTVVLTGAMVPFAFGSSDGLFNLGSALSFVQVLPPGVYIAMNGRCFAWHNVRKNKAEGVFEEIR